MFGFPAGVSGRTVGFPGGDLRSGADGLPKSGETWGVDFQNPVGEVDLQNPLPPEFKVHPPDLAL